MPRLLNSSTVAPPPLSRDRRVRGRGDRGVRSIAGEYRSWRRDDNAIAANAIQRQEVPAFAGMTGASRAVLKLSLVTRHLSLLVLLVSLTLFSLTVQSQSVKIGLLKYAGGGDWYVNPTSLPNLIKFCNETLHTDIAKDPVTVEPGSRDIFSLPFIHMTGHGNFLFSPQEAENLRQYLLAGGFLHIDDNYGLDQFVRREMKKVFPELDFVELPATHPVFQKPNLFPDGLPKIHEHDGKRPQGFGLIREGRLVCFYSYESDLGDGWEDPQVHNDSQETRLKALKMGANLIHYVFIDK